MSEIVADMRRAVRFIRQHAGEYGVDSNRIGVFGSSAGGQLALLHGTTADSGNPSAPDAVLKESSRVAAVVAYFPPTDLSRWGNARVFPATKSLTQAEAAQYSPIRFVSPGAAPSLIVHGDAGRTWVFRRRSFESKARDTGSRAPIPRAPMPKCCGGSSSISAARRNRISRGGNR